MSSLSQSSGEKSIVEVKIVKVRSIPLLKFNRRPSVSVEIVAENAYHRTEAMRKNTSQWDAKFTLPPLGDSSMITFNVIRRNIFRDKCLSKAQINVHALLERQRQQNQEDVILSMTDVKGNPISVQLLVRVTEKSLPSTVVALELARTAERKLLLPQIVEVSDDTTGLATIPGQKDFITPASSLLSEISILLKFGDDIAKIHPYVNFAWQVLSVGLKMVEEQKSRDQKISDLVRTMEVTYSFVSLADKWKKNKVLQDVVEQIVKQTIECGFFIQEYARYNFGRRAITQPFAGTDDLISQFCAKFERLRKNFDSGVNLDTALILSRATSTIDVIRLDQILSKLKAAEIDEYDRVSCLPQTRLDVIKTITEWIAGDGERVLWLHGLAGSGKSVLSTTIAQIMRDLQRLGAFFFFDQATPGRNAATLIRTVAYQLAIFDTRIGAAVSQIVERSQNIAGMPLEFQFTNLLTANALTSIEWFDGPIVVVIDALDECGSQKDRKMLIQALSKGFHVLPSFIRVVIASRPEPDITDAFASHPAVYPYFLDIDSLAAKEDILEFIRFRMAEIRQNNKPLSLSPDWPGDEAVQSLGMRAAGLFIWASTACLYIESHDPRIRLKELIDNSSMDTNSMPFASLDTLYKTALESAGNWRDPLFSGDCCGILGVILCARIPISCATIDSLLELPRPSLQSISRLGCVLRWGEMEPIHILHPSFRDYLSLRSQNEPWFIDLQKHNEELAVCCIKLLEAHLRENMCNLALPHFIQKDAIPEPVAYASRFWSDHVCAMSRSAEGLGEQIYDFLSRHLLHWIEAQAILKSHDNTIRSLQNLHDWILISVPLCDDLRELVYDAHRLAQYFSSTIKEHPLLVYWSALPFTPIDTNIYQKFYDGNLPKVICGVEKSWSRQLHIFQGHSEDVNSVAFSNDGSRVVSGSSDKTVRVWDASTGFQILPLLQGHKDSVSSVAFSNDGSKIASGSFDSTVRIWNASTGIEMLPPLRGHDGWVRSVAFSSDGSKIVSGSDDNTIRLWDITSGASSLPPLQGHSGMVLSVAFSNDGSKIASGSDDNTIRVWDAGTGAEILSPLQGHDGIVWAVAFSNDGSRIVSGSSDTTVRVWNALTGVEAFPPLRGHDDWVRSVAFSSDDKKIVSGSYSGTIRIWETETGIETVPPLQGHENWVLSVAFSQDGLRIVSGSRDRTIRIWDATNRLDTPSSLNGHNGKVWSVTFSCDGSKLASGSDDGTIRVWNLRSGVQTLPPLPSSDTVLSVAFSKDGSKIVSGLDDNTIQIWDAITGAKVLPTLRGHEDSVWSVAFSNDGSKIISGSNDKTIRIWDANTGIEALPPLQGHDDWIRCVAFSTDGTRIVSGSCDGTTRIWDANTGMEIIPPLRGDGIVLSVAFSNDGSKVVSGSSGYIIRVWDASTGVEALSPLRGHEAPVKSVSFSDDDSKIISGSSDGTVRVWDLRSGAEVFPPQFRGEAVRNIPENKQASQALTLHQKSNSLLPSPAQGRPIISLSSGGWFTNIATGDILGKIPGGASQYHWRTQGTKYVGWTGDNKLVLIDFPSVV